MTKLISTIVFVLTLTAVQAQNIVDKHFSHCKGTDQYTSICILGKMFDIASEIEVDVKDTEFNEFKNMISHIESFNMIIGEDIPDIDSEYKAALKLVSNSHEELMRISTKNEKLIVKIKESNNIVNEVIFIGNVHNKFIVTSLMGEIAMSELGKVIDRVQNNNFDDSHLQMFDKDFEGFKVYPNPIGRSANLTVEFPNDMSESKINIFDLNGRLIREISTSGIQETISMNNLLPGTYIVQIIKGDVRMNKKIIVQ